jgi:hypothetical protein
MNATVCTAERCIGPFLSEFRFRASNSPLHSFKPSLPLWFCPLPDYDAMMIFAYAADKMLRDQPDRDLATLKGADLFKASLKASFSGLQAITRVS